MDRRQKKTREAIFKAFTVLLSQKHYHRITVQDILDEADVGRTTFYAHFETKEFLLRDLCGELFGHITDTALGQTACACGRAEDSAFLHLIRHLQQNDRGILELLSSENNGLFLDYFKAEVCRLVTTVYGDRINPSLPQAYMVNHIAATFVETVRWWLSRGQRETPEEVTACFSAVTEPLLMA